MPDTEKKQWLDRVPELDNRKRFPSLAPDKATKLFDELLVSGDGAITGIIDALNEVDDGKDWKARFVLGALASHVGAPERKKDRKNLEQIYAIELQADRPASVKTFLAMQLQWCGSAQSAPALAAQFSSKDPALVAACAATLCAIGKPAIPSLKSAREKSDDAAKAAIDHALMQIPA